MAPKKERAEKENVSLGPSTREGENVFGVCHIFASFNDSEWPLADWLRLRMQCDSMFAEASHMRRLESQMGLSLFVFEQTQDSWCP